MAKQKDIVSIVIPTYNEAKNIGRLLASIEKQTYPKIETIVVDDASKDWTVKIAKKYHARVFQRGHAERSIQRNFGAQMAKGQYLLFLDADMRLSPKVVTACVEAVKKDTKTPAATILEKSVASSFWEKVKGFERSFYNLEGDELTDAARFFNKRVFLKIGGYDEKITGPEDWDLTERLKRKKYKIAVIASLIYHYERIPSILSLIKKKYYYALKSHRYLRKHKTSVFSAKTIYFLRPVFYKNLGKLIANPTLTLAMFLMLFLEQVAGLVGYLIGVSKND